MKLGRIDATELAQRLRGAGLGIQSGPFHVRIRSPFETIARGLHTLYADFETVAEEEFFDFHVEVKPPPNLRRWYRPQVIFTVDDHRPFKPLPAHHALPVLEWGLNWCIANHAHQFLMIHAAVVEKEGLAAILPGPPGSGKSTLCTALVARGWRLFSDEMALIDLETGELSANPRPISLKNDSIDIVRNFWPEAVIGPLAQGTDKGTVAHVKPPQASVARQQRTCRPGVILFPKYRSGHSASLVPLTRADTLMQLITSTFNYNGLGQKGFLALSKIVESSACLKLTYSRLDDAISIFDGLNHR